MKKFYSLLFFLVYSSSGLFGASLTLYNQNFALIRDEVNLSLKEGLNDVIYDQATTTLEPDSVVLKLDSSVENGIKLYEQSYRRDVASNSYLLSLFEGKTIDFIKENNNGDPQFFRGKIIRSGYNPSYLGQNPSEEPIIEIDGKLRFGLPGTPLFPSLGEGSLLKPRLEWKVFSNQAYEGTGSLSYLTGGLSWDASYNLILPEKGDQSSFSGWVTINNASGRRFDGVDVNLLAGDVNRISSPVIPSGVLYEAAAMAQGRRDVEVTQKAFDDYHLYTLPQPIDLKSGETKQIEFVAVDPVIVKTVYRYGGSPICDPRGSAPNYTDPDVTLAGSEKVSVVRQFKNSADNNLGIPLPAGRLRMYRSNGEQVEFVGENTIDHTPKNEMVEIVTGNAFDLLVTRVRTEFKASPKSYIGTQTLSESFTLTIKNRRDQEALVNIIQYLRGPNWEIVSETYPHRKTSATEVQWDVVVVGNSEAKLEYTVQYQW